MSGVGHTVLRLCKEDPFGDRATHTDTNKQQSGNFHLFLIFFSLKFRGAVAINPTRNTRVSLIKCLPKKKKKDWRLHESNTRPFAD